MTIYFGADHRGFKLKETLKQFLTEKAHEVVDLGAKEMNPADDYTDFAHAVAVKVSQDPENARGVVVCGSGIGADVTANRVANVRAALAAVPDQMYAARHDDDANIAVFAADFTSEDDAKKILQVFLVTPFGGDPRYLRRIAKIDGLQD